MNILLLKKLNNMKYKLILGLIFIAFNSQAHIQAKEQSQFMIARQIAEFKKPPVNIAEIKNENIDFVKDSTVEEEIKSLSYLWMDAMLKHDSVTLNRLMAADYTLHSWDGNKSRMTPRSTWLYNLFNNLQITRWEQTAVSIQVYGDVAIITSSYNWSGNFFKTNFDSQGYLADIWVRKNNQWQVVSRTAGTLPESKTLDGK